MATEKLNPRAALEKMVAEKTAAKAAADKITTQNNVTLPQVAIFYSITRKRNLMFKLFAVIIASLITITLTHAAGENCYQIQNQDAKNFCLATAKNDSNYCYQISKQDEKNMCLAVTRRDKNYCYQISKQDEKNLCLAKF